MIASSILSGGFHCPMPVLVANWVGACQGHLRVLSDITAVLIYLNLTVIVIIVFLAALAALYLPLVTRGISKSIRHFIRHSTILSVTRPSYPSLDHLIRHSTISSVT